MSYLQELCASEVMTPFFEDEEVINYSLDAASMVTNELPEEIFYYVSENMDKFVVPGDLEATYENIATFAADWTKNLMLDLANV